MAGDDLGAFLGDAEELEDAGADVAVAGAMETVAAHAMLLVELVGQGVHVGVVGHGLVEGGVEDAHLREVGQQGLNGVYAFDVGGVVERCQVVAGLEVTHHLGGEDDTLGELLAAVHHAVAYGAELMEVAQHGVLALGEDLEDELHAGGMLGHGGLELEFLDLGGAALGGNRGHGGCRGGYHYLVFDDGVGQPDLLDAARGDDRLIGHVVESVFYAGRAAIKNQYFHYEL